MPLRPQEPIVRSAPFSTTDSYDTAQSGPLPVSSLTTYQRRTFGNRPRIPSSNDVKLAWNTTASASALSKRYTISSGP